MKRIEVPVFERDPTKLYAGDLRCLGIEIPDSIPDCAHVDRSSVVFRGPDFEPATDDGLLRGTISVIFTAPFEWVTVTMGPPGE